MKRIMALFCAALLSAALLCGCDEAADAQSIGDDIENFAEDAKDNAEEMGEDAAVRDDDGYIGVDRPAESVTQTEPDGTHGDAVPDDEEEEIFGYDDILNDDPTENEIFD